MSNTTQVTPTDYSLFRSIIDFVGDMLALLPPHQDSPSITAARLYQRLLRKTMVIDDTMILYHLSLFREYLRENVDAIVTHDTSRFQTHSIVFSERIFLDVHALYAVLQEDEDSVLFWNYLITLYDQFYPETDQDLPTPPAPQPNLLEGLGGENPMEMISSIMQSDMFSEVMNTFTHKIESGEINLPKLMSSMDHLVQGMGGQMDERNPESVSATSAPIPCPDHTPASVGGEEENKEEEE